MPQKKSSTWLFQQPISDEAEMCSWIFLFQPGGLDGVRIQGN